MLHIVENKVLTSATERTCEDCKRTIFPGQEYRYFAGSNNGVSFIYRSCVGCTLKLDNLRCS